MKRWITVIGVAVPGLVLAAFGLVHPAFLGPSTAMAWWQLHIPLIVLFPLLAAALWVVLRGERGVLAWVARIAAYLFACLYTALDTISGIGAGLVTDRLGGGPAEQSVFFAVGDELGRIGVWCLAVACLLAGVVLSRRDGVRVVPGTAVLMVASYGLYVFHIFSPYGALSMVGYAGGFALLAAARRPAVPAVSDPAPVTSTR